MSFESSVERLLVGDHSDPHAILGPHPSQLGAQLGVVVRVLVPDAVTVECVLDDGSAMEFAREAEGPASLYAVFIPDETVSLSYRLRLTYADGTVLERDDAYRFPPTLGAIDLHLFNEGTHRRLWEVLGAHAREIGGVTGVSAAVWAPNARRVSLVGDFCGWDGRVYPMRRLGSSGVWEIFIPALEAGALYKFELVTREGAIRLKTDPFAFKIEQYPGTAAIVQLEESYSWRDEAWLEASSVCLSLQSPY